MDPAAFGLVAFAVIAVVVAADSVAPIVPSEMLVVSAAVGAASWPSLAGVAIAASVGAFVGDALVYRLGRRLGPDRRDRALSRRWAGHLARIESMVQRMSTPLIIGGRFIPLGRTSVAFAAGAAGVGRRRYFSAASAGAATWGVVTAGLGRAGAAVTDHPLLRVGLGLAFCAGVGALAMGVQAWRATAAAPAEPSR